MVAVNRYSTGTKSDAELVRIQLRSKHKHKWNLRYLANPNRGAPPEASFQNILDSERYILFTFYTIYNTELAIQHPQGQIANRLRMLLPKTIFLAAATGISLALLYRKRQHSLKLLPPKNRENFEISSKSLPKQVEISLLRPDIEETLKEVIWVEEPTGRKVYHLKFKPNEEYPGHMHGSEEFCFLVQGALTDNFSTKHAPCFFYNPNKSMHHNIQAGKKIAL